MAYIPSDRNFREQVSELQDDQFIELLQRTVENLREQGYSRVAIYLDEAVVRLTRRTANGN